MVAQGRVRGPPAPVRVPPHRQGPRVLGRPGGDVALGVRLAVARRRRAARRAEGPRDRRGGATGRRRRDHRRAPRRPHRPRRPAPASAWQSARRTRTGVPRTGTHSRRCGADSARRFPQTLPQRLGRGAAGRPAAGRATMPHGPRSDLDRRGPYRRAPRAALRASPSRGRRPSAKLAAPVGKRPNVLVILFDDVGWGDFGCYGGGVAVGAPTPNIDRLARRRPAA